MASKSQSSVHKKKGKRIRDHDTMTFFPRLFQDTKQSIFNVFFTLLKDYEYALIPSVGIAVIQIIQILNFAFDQEIRYVWADDKLASGLGTITEYLYLSTYFRKINWDIYIAFFYVLLGVFLFTFLLLFYLGYSLGRKKFTITLPMLLLKFLLELTTTVFHLPMFQYFLSISRCHQLKGSAHSTHVYFPAVNCWEGTHLLHGIISLVFTFLFFVLSVLVTLFFFESRNIPSNARASYNGRFISSLMIYRSVICLIFNYIEGSHFWPILLLSYSAGGFGLLKLLLNRHVFHREEMNNCWRTLVLFNFYTSVMLIFAKLFETTIFEGSLIVWLIGTPVIIVISIFNISQDQAYLLLPINKFKNADELIQQVNYLISLMNNHENDKKSNVVLNGYIEYHRIACPKHDCPLKLKLQGKAGKSKENNQIEKSTLLVQTLNKLYQKCLKKFDKNAALRISYGNFLGVQMKSKQQAIEQFMDVEENSREIDFEFIGFRSRKLLEEENTDKGNDYADAGAFSTEQSVLTQIKTIQQSIDRTSSLMLDFWAQIIEDNPDLLLVYESGLRLLTAINQTENHWLKFNNLSKVQPKAIRLYAKYLINILNDISSGQELLEKANSIENNIKVSKRNFLNHTTSTDLTLDSVPTIIALVDQEDFGVISNMNMAASLLFGYSKTELLGRPVKALMPKLYADKHDEFIENYMNNINENSFKERQVFGITRANYIFPLNLKTRMNQSAFEGVSIIGAIRLERYFKPCCFILVNPDGLIENISAGCLEILGIDLSILQSERNGEKNWEKPNIEKYVNRIEKYVIRIDF